MTMVDAVVPGRPYPQGSKRAFVVGGRARLTESSGAGHAAYRADLVHALAQTMLNRRLTRFEGPVAVALTFEFERPKSHFTSRGELSATGRRTPAPSTRAVGDLDKLTRAALDALELADVVANDAQVVELQATKRYGDRARTIVVAYDADTNQDER